jgi:hypothetical protein
MIADKNQAENPRSRKRNLQNAENKSQNPPDEVMFLARA